MKQASNKKTPNALIHNGYSLVPMYRFTTNAKKISKMNFKRRIVYALPGYPGLGYVPGIGKVKITPIQPKTGNQIIYKIVCVGE